MREASTTIVTQLVELVTSLERENSDTAAGLYELIDNGVHHVTGSQYAGITLAEKSKSVNSVAATHRYPMVLDAIQNKYGEGPCLAAAWEHHATHIALAWSMMRRQDQFRSALASRDIIGQAKGVIMERFDLDAVEAFELLTRLSQQSNTRVVDIAAALIDSEHPLKQRRR